MQTITIQSVEERLGTWLAEKADASIAQEAQSLPLRRDMVTLLTFVRDNRVVGTQATGNMPLKAIREVTAQFVHPPKLEETEGHLTWRVRSETDVWVLYFLHILADVGRLVKGGRVRRWRVTGPGERFLEAEPRLQAAFLLAVWWYRVNWIVAYPYTGMGSGLPPGFSAITLAHLWRLPAGVYVSFPKFADELIAGTGLRWGVPDRPIARPALHGAIEAMVIRRLIDFGALKDKHRKERIGNAMLPVLAAFKITPWGAALFEALYLIGAARQSYGE